MPKSNNKDEQTLFNKLDISPNIASNPKLDFELTLEYVLYKKHEINGFKIHTTLEGGQQAVDICKFAGNIMKTNKLAKYFDLNATSIFGVYTNMTDESEFDYTIGCLATTRIKDSNQLISHLVPSAQYAKFSLNRLDRVKEAWRHIYGYWFPQNDCYRAKGFDFEIYHPHSVDIYIPILSPKV